MVSANPVTGGCGLHREFNAGTLREEAGKKAEGFDSSILPSHILDREFVFEFSAQRGRGQEWTEESFSMSESVLGPESPIRVYQRFARDTTAIFGFQGIVQIRTS